MIFLLTGDIQTGKTRWLSGMVAALQAVGVDCEGVLAPGIWRELPNGSFEKRGIENLLLPQRERILFARHSDWARELGEFDEQAESAKARMEWYISDEAIARVNAHLASLHTHVPRGRGPFLVIDELGPLELKRKSGLTEALALIEAGSRGRYAHALVVVRQRGNLVYEAQERFAKVWDGAEIIKPDEEARARLLQLFS